ncbi:siderophore-interacting protein [Streptomyces lichenis]|uniref:SIP domain-containing protein n=1 Tax=Streptomyces lichenis TaxID=2306967 RepID=A0ABT0IAE3_9ACTN|nr:siderophore-interacting protein [Streptomyces lichenis]MCK8678257.1 SIP domain-containing protein [Streptomyces lichenis]
MPTRSPRSVATFPIVLRELTVLRAENLTPGMRRITLGGEQLHAFHRDGFDLPELRTEGFDDHVKFFFADEEGRLVLPRQNTSSLDWPDDGRPVAKDYTPVRFDPAAGEIDFDFVRHEGGVASTWAEQAKPGESAWIAGPKMSHSHPEGADWILVAGDETALPAIARWLHEMPEGTRAKVLIEIGEDSHRQELSTRADADITWLSRDGAPAGTTDLLEQAVRDLQWLPGTVFAWVAGEAISLKGIRRHLATERQVPRDHTHITGYWRRTAPPAAAVSEETAAAAVEEDEDDDAHERLHALTDLAPGYAIRAAVTLGLFELVESGTRTLDALHRATAADRSTLAALLSYLVSLDVLDGAADGYRLTPISEELVEDDHSADEYHLDGAEAHLDASLSGLLHTLRTGEAGYRTSAGLPLAAAIAQDDHLAGTARAAIEEEARWIAPGVVRAHDWSGVPALTATGHGSATVVNALVKAFPELRVRITALPSALRAVKDRILDTDVLPKVELTPATGPVPARPDSVLLISRLLEQLADEDAVQVLAEAGAALPEGGTLLLVEPTTPADTDDVDAVLHHLRLKCAFGSGVRDEAHLTALAERAGLTVHTVTDIGWDSRMWHLTPAS